MKSRIVSFNLSEAEERRLRQWIGTAEGNNRTDSGHWYGMGKAATKVADRALDRLKRALNEKG